MYIKKFNLIAIIFSLIITFSFWQLLDISTALTPGASDHQTNLEKYYEKYHSLSIEEFLQSSSSIPNYFKTKLDIGYDLISFIFKTLDLRFENFLFVSIFVTFLAYVNTFSKITSCKYLIIYFILLLISFFWMSFTFGSTLRQGIASSILFYFLFRNKILSLKKDILVIFLASTIHLSAIIFIPYLFFEKLFINRLKLITFFFVIVCIFYTFNLNYFVSDFIYNLANILDLDIRSLTYYKIDHPTTGFSILKLLATVLPPFLYILALSIGSNPIESIHKRLYLYYIYPSIIGMLLSQMSYYDRILLFSWTISPFLLTFYCFKLYPIFAINFNKIIRNLNIKV